MREETNMADGEKGCGPQPYAEVPPDHGWEFERLTAYVQQLNQRISDGERSLTPQYWCLGSALSKARRFVARGAWSEFLRSLGIDKTRGSKSRAIFRAFATVEAVRGLTVEQAYAARRPATTSAEKPGRRERSTVVQDDLGCAIDRLAQQTERCGQEPAATSHGEILALLATVRRSLDCLRLLETRLKQALEACEE